jgi:hypothetical protein
VYAKNLSRADHLNGTQQAGNQLSKMVELQALRNQNDRAKGTIREGLLMLQISISRDEDLEVSGFYQAQKITVRDAGPAFTSNGWDGVLGDLSGEPNIEVLVQKNPLWLHRSSSDSKFGEQCVGSLFKEANRLFPRNARVALKEAIEGWPILKMIEQRLNGHASPDEHRGAAQNLGTAVYDSLLSHVHPPRGKSRAET